MHDQPNYNVQHLLKQLLTSSLHTSHFVLFYKRLVCDADQDLHVQVLAGLNIAHLQFVARMLHSKFTVRLC